MTATEDAITRSPAVPAAADLSPEAPLPTPTPGPTLPPAPTPTPQPEELLEMGLQAYANGDNESARSLFVTLLRDASDADESLPAQYHLARAYQAEGNYQEALAAWGQWLDAAPAEHPDRARAHFLRGEALAALGRWEESIVEYQQYRESVSLVDHVVQGRIGDAYVRLGDWAAAALAYRAALDEPSDFFTRVALYRSLADVYLQTQDYLAAVEQYDAILALTSQSRLQAEMHRRAGDALEREGDTEGAVVRWRQAIATDRRSSHAHAAVVGLLRVEAPVDEFERGIVNYHNGVYGLAIAALERYITANPDHDGEPYLWLARSHNAIGEPTRSIQTFNTVIERYPDCACVADAWLDKAQVQSRSGDTDGARVTYQAFAERYPEHEQAPEALWLAATLALRNGDLVQGALELQSLADRYPEAEQAARALYALGVGAYQQGLSSLAIMAWERHHRDFPDERSEAALFWLGYNQLLTGKEAEAVETWTTLLERDPAHYYTIMARREAEAAGVDDQLPVSPSPPPDHHSEVGARAVVTDWLRTWLEAAAGAEDLSVLPASVEENLHYRRGRELLALGLRTEALRAFDQLRETAWDDPLHLYPLALEFRDLGVYGLSIRCAARLLSLSPGGVHEAPRQVQELSYPRYFPDLVEEAADRFALDPLLLYALIRQESLFEQGATSFAAAQGLAQVIPPTGEWIAERLRWPNYRNELLYRPHVSVTFGAYYLRNGLDMFNENWFSALVGYNAGPGNARFFRNQSGDDDLLFVEIITITEPRIYVQRITEHYEHYRRLYTEQD